MKTKMLALLFAGAMSLVGCLSALAFTRADGPQTLDLPVSVNVVEIDVDAQVMGPMSFGTIVPGDTGGALTLDAAIANAPVASLNSGVVADLAVASNHTLQGTSRPGTIRLVASHATSVTVLLEDTLTLPHATEPFVSLPLSAIRINSNVAGDGTTGEALPGAAPFYIHIGGVLTLPDNLTGGAYAANLPVIIDFE